MSAPAQFAPDETRAYDDEGIGSPAGSMHSLDTDADDKDWKETRQVRPFLEYLKKITMGRMASHD